ncbi:putative beta-glucosidase btgE [Cladobotryum mycophilum]|uniref:Probable beta-glucosidase btgE n=1 Tax=Cladobotryum mycophilum TaxID=491253 RepID=A0ABR0S6W4_9HYPO
MKGVIAATALAALTGAASAHNHHHRRAHELFAKRNTTEEVCQAGCTTYWTTIYGEPTLVAPAPPAEQVTTTSAAALTSTPAAVVTEVPATTTVVVVPTPISYSCPTPGTYTFPATTITVTDTTTVCGATSSQVPPGTHTVGGVTTTVEGPTTVTAPVVTVSTSGGVTTSTIVQTTYVCPSAGTYTINPITTTVTETTVIVYPIPTSYNPGTYTAPEQVVTVTKTGYVTWCPFTSSGLPAKPTSPVNVPAPAPPKPTQEAPKPAPSQESEQPKPQPQQPKPQPPASHPSGPLSSGNDHLGITYTPYDSMSGACKSAGEVDGDIAKLKKAGFSVIRAYSTDCNTLETVGSACEKYGLKLILGIFVKGPGCSYNSPDIKPQVDAIAAWGKWNLVELIVVGNEAIMNGFCSASQLRELVITVKSKCSSYQGPYTISETLNIWQRGDVSSAICDVVEMAGANIHPYFNPNVAAASAGDFVAGQIDLLGKICAGKPAINLECGWPTSGHCNGIACPGKVEQAQALESIRKKVGNRTIFFSFSDDHWKDEGACACEKSWGSYSAFGY